MAKIEPREPTEGESLALVHVVNLFWTELGQSVAKHLAMVDPALHSELLYRLQDASSVFSTNYEKHTTSVELPADWCEQLLSQMVEL